MTNDETYYLAFSKNLQLSYLDAPPFVSYLNAIQVKLGLVSPLASRALVVLLHFISTLFLMALVYRHCAEKKDLAQRLLITFLMAYLIPVFGVFSVFILPDTGLILSLSVMLWAADKVVFTRILSWNSVIILGVALGLGLLSKYHIFPLGGGILLGLLIELTLYTQWQWLNLLKLFVSGMIGLFCALPLFIWNVENHFASFIFQFQHGFSSNTLQLKTLVAFILGSIAYLTPWFAYLLLKINLSNKKHWFVLIPFFSLLVILGIGSLHKSTLPHWISPAFWLFIPYTAIYANEQLGQLKLLFKFCQYTALIWCLLIGILLIPNGLIRVKQLSTHFNPDAKIFKDLLLWQELPALIKKNTNLSESIDHFLQQKLPANCTAQQPVIGAFRWFWAAQFEYHQLFPTAKVLNLDLGASNFYLWRDHWSDFANCPVLLLGSGSANDLDKIMTTNHQLTIHGLGDYQSLNMDVIEGTLRDQKTLQSVQNQLLTQPHY